MASSSSSTHTRCAACKFLGQTCLSECAYAPCFPADQPTKYANVHRVFGFSNVTKLINEIEPCQLQDAANTLAYQAEMRLRDPVYGCIGVVSLFEKQLRQLEMELNCAKAELAKHQRLGMISTYDEGVNMMGNGEEGTSIGPHLHDFLSINNENLAMDVEVGRSSKRSRCDANKLMGLDGSAGQAYDIDGGLFLRL